MPATTPGARSSRRRSAKRCGARCARLAYGRSPLVPQDQRRRGARGGSLDANSQTTAHRGRWRRRVRWLDGAEVARRFPQLNCEQVRWAILEKDGGYLTARRACAAVLEGFLAEGGEYRQLAVQGPIAPGGGALSSIALSDGSRLTADGFVFACGPWLGALFPDAVGARVKPTRQEVFFFGTPSGDRRFTEEALPVWADHGTRFMYGIPGNEWRGFKVADDTRGPVIDPTTESRVPSPGALQIARDYLAYRFPGLKGAPLLESRVCQYEQSPDEHFIIDRHPQAANAWIVGGGSGHGFKHGPAVGELVARLVLTGAAGAGAPHEQIRLSRFAH